MGTSLTLVVCGAPLASRAGDVAAALTEAGWSVSTVVTDAAGLWWCPEGAEGVDRPRPDCVVACPLTFNTANKVASGVMDTPASDVLCDALGAGVPVVAVIMVNDRLWGHPVWANALDVLSGAGVWFVDAISGRVGPPAPVRSGSGPEVVEAFDPWWVVAAID